MFTLPDTVNAEGVKADYKNGVLTVTPPRRRSLPRQIKVKCSNDFSRRARTETGPPRLSLVRAKRIMNSIKTVLLLGLLSGLLLVGGEYIGGRQGLMIGLLIAAGMNFFSYFFSDKLALMAYSAQPVTPSELPEVYNRVAPIIQGLTQRMGLPMPKLWLIPESSPNAFATGRNPEHASVAFTEGILPDHE